MHVFGAGGERAEQRGLLVSKDPFVVAGERWRE